MKLRDLEYAEIRGGNVLIIPCQGNHDCCGRLRIPFRPGIGGAPSGPPTWNGVVWERQSGETLDDLTLSPSIDAAECGHFVVRNGSIA